MRSDSVAASRAIVRIVALESCRAEILEEGLFNRLVSWRILELILDGELEVAELTRRRRGITALLAFDVARAISHV